MGLTKTLNWWLDLIFPKACLGCGQDGSYLCPNCFNLLPLASAFNCFICGRRSPTGYVCTNCQQKYHPSLSGILVASDWNNLLLRQVIYEYKYRFVKELSDPLTTIIISFLERHKINNLLNCSPDHIIIIPVPHHGRRLAWRGFNQSEILAKKICAHFKAPLANDILIRSRHSLPQRKITDQKARIQNIKNAFSLSPKLKTEKNYFLKNRIVILIDDVCTTGATFQECAKTLKPLSPKEIWGLVIARG